MLGDADAFPSFDVSRFVTCTDGIGQAACLPGHTRDRDESMTLLRPAPAQSPHGRTHGDRIRPVSARHHLRRSRQRSVPPILWNTREIERGRFRFADGRRIRSALSKTERSCGKGELTESPITSRHSGPGRSLVSGRPPSQRNADVCGSGIPEADQSGNGRGLDGSAGAWCSGDVDRSQS